jgi:glycosyltransferase involved in cell wall biosynthesis
VDVKLRSNDEVAKKVIIYPNVSEDGIGRYVSKLLKKTGVSKSNENYGLLSIGGLLKSLPENYPIIHIPHFIVPIFKKNIIVCTIQDLTPLVFKTELNFFQRCYIAIRVFISIHNSDYLIFTSNNTLVDAKRIFKKLPDHSVIPLGVDNDTVENISSNEKLYPYEYFLCVGRRRAHKNIERVIYALFKAKKLSNIHLIFLGKEDEHDGFYKDIINKLKIESRVHFIGGVADDILAKHYKQAIALLYPSLYEGFGLPILEAMANSCPVITSNTSSMPEVAGNAAWIIDPYSEVELINAMESIYSNDQLRVRLISIGLIRAKELNWESCAKKTMDVYRYLLNKNGY